MEKITTCGETCVQVSVRGFLSGVDGGIHEEMVSWDIDYTHTHTPHTMFVEGENVLDRLR